MEKIVRFTPSGLEKFRGDGVEVYSTLESRVKEKLKGKASTSEEVGLPGFVPGLLLTDLQKLTMNHGNIIDNGELQQTAKETDYITAKKVWNSSIRDISLLQNRKDLIGNVASDGKLPAPTPVIINAEEMTKAESGGLPHEQKPIVSAAKNEISVMKVTEASKDLNAPEATKGSPTVDKFKETHPGKKENKNSEMVPVSPTLLQQKALLQSESTLPNKASTGQLVSNSPANNVSAVNADSVSGQDINGGRLTYTFAEWGKSHQVNIQLADVKTPITLQPSNDLVHQRLADYEGQHKKGQPEWVFQDEHKQKPNPYESDEEAS